MVEIIIVVAGGLAMTAAATASAMVYQGRKKNEMKRLMRASLSAMGLEPSPTGEALRARGTLAAGASYLIDLTPAPDNPLVFCHVGVHIHRSKLLPDRCTFEVRGRSTTNTMLAYQVSMGLSEEGFKTQIDATSLLKALYPDGLQELLRLEAYKLEPLAKLRYQDQWISLERMIQEETLSVRELETEKEKIDFLHGIIAQTLQALEKFDGEISSAAELWYRAFLAAPDFSNGRTEALKQLMTRHAGSDYANKAWEYVLESGNLYDVLYIVNNHQKRALKDLSEERLVAFANAVLQQDNLDPSNLPSLIGQRLDVGALSNPHLDWRARYALLELWMFSLSGENDDLTGALAGLIQDATRAQLVEILRAIKRTAWVGAARALASQSMAGTHHEIDVALTRAWMAIAEKHEEGIAGRADVERALLDLLVVHREPEVVKLLGLLAGKSALPTLHELSKGNALVSPIAREAKRSIEHIVERLGKETRGALSVSQTEEQGQLSIATGESGSLTQVDSDHQT